MGQAPIFDRSGSGTVGIEETTNTVKLDVTVKDDAPAVLAAVKANVVILGKAGVTTTNKYGKEVLTILDSFNVNTAIMRCMTKALALHGLGTYIYAGQDLPESDEKEAPTPVATAPKPIVRTATKSVQPKEWDDSDASRKLFADGMIEWTSHCTTVAGLNSYWKSNELQLDSLKETHPPLYEGVLKCFKELKTKLNQTEKPNE